MSPRWLHWPSAAASGADYTIVLIDDTGNFSENNVIDDGGIGFVSARLDEARVRIRFSTEGERDAFEANFTPNVSEAVISNPSDTLIFDGNESDVILDGEFDDSGTLDISFQYNTGITYSTGQITIEIYVSGAP